MLIKGEENKNKQIFVDMYERSLSYQASVHSLLNSREEKNTDTTQAVYCQVVH